MRIVERRLHERRCQKRRERERIENGVNLTDFMENAPVGFHCMRPNGFILWVNKLELDMLGYTRNEYVGHHISEFHADQEAVHDILQRLVQGETLHDYEARLLCKGGSTKDVLISSNGVWEHGQMVYTRCFTRDITDRKQTENSLSQTQAQYRTLLESTGEGIFGIDIDGKCTFINQAAARMLGYRSEEILGKQTHSLIHHSKADGSPHPHETCAIYRAFRTGTECRVEDEVLWRRDGTAFPVEYSSYPIFEKGAVTGAVIAFTDITERQRTIQALRESEEQFRQLAEHIREAFWMSNPEKNRILYISPAYEQIWGRSRESLYASPSSWIESIHPDDRERVLSDALTKQISGEYDIEYRIVHLDGSICWIHDRAFPIRDKSGIVYRLAGIAEDITEYKRANQELQLSLAQSRAISSHMEAAREQERLRIGREIHDNLGGVLTYLKLDLTRLNKNIAEGTIEIASHELQTRINTMVNVMDDAIKTVQQISLEMTPVLLDHCGLAAAIIWQAREFEGRTGIQCMLTASPNVGEVNQEQSILVFRIFQEALTNVARHAHANTVRVSLREDDGRLVLDIQDDGDGIPEKEVFDPTSFGLLGMRERARLAGGELYISSMNGKGTVITARVSIKRP